MTFPRSLLIRAGFLLHQRLWIRRAVTLGVRALVLDDAGGIFLVRHTYVPGWYLPGGGVDRGEAAETAITRELMEEGGLRCLERPQLHAVYRNGRRDHVVCYIVRHFDQKIMASHSWEIADAGFFPLDALPDGTTRATRRRLSELVEGLPIAADW